MNNPNLLAGKLRELREKSGMSLGDLASITGKDRAQINKIESGATTPSVDTLDVLLEPFGCHLDVVRNGNEDARFITAEDIIRSIAKFANIDVTINNHSNEN